MIFWNRFSGPQGGLMYRLQVYDPKGTLASSLVLSLKAVTIGRDASCELPLPDVNISRRHARIEPMGRFFVVRDLKSTNGTWVNQNPVRMHLLKHGDVIRVGNCRLVIQVTEDLPAGTPGRDKDDLDETQTKIIGDPFSPGSGLGESLHTVKINVSKGALQFPTDQKLRERLLRLHEISRKLGFIETPNVLCGQAVEIILAELRADRASILVPEGEELTTVASRVAPSEKGQPFNIHYEILKGAIDDLSAILIEDVAQDRRFKGGTGLPAHRIRSIMCVPLVAQTNLQGVIYVDRTSTAEAFSEDDLRFLAVIGNQVAINLANARLFEEVLLEKQKVQAVVSSLKDGLVITDQDLMVQSSNVAAATILSPGGMGYLDGRNLLELVRAADPSHADQDLGAMARAGKEFQARIQQGSDVRVYGVSVAVIEPSEGNRAGYAFSFRDTTDLLHLQELKSEFIRNASHKLRTPLTVILAGLDFLRGHADAPGSEEGREEVLTGMEKNLQQLQRLVTRFLEFAELDRSLEKFHDLDLRETVAVAVGGIASMARERKIEIANKISRTKILRVQGDTDRLVQCLYNILENSIKFAPEGSKVIVNAETDDQWIRILVEDEGPGIPPEDLKDIFTGFHQVEKIPTGEVPGAGLGLTIAKSIIHAHQGIITAQSPVAHSGKGTQITLSIPRSGALLAGVQKRTEVLQTL